jgi:hypothetical protein
MGGFYNPMKSVSFTDGYWELLNWLKVNVNDNQIVALGPTHDYDFFWHVKLPGKYLFNPYVNSFDEFINFLHKEKVNYFVMDEDLLLRREWVYSDYFSIDESAGLTQIKEIKGLELIFKDEVKPVKFMVFRVKRQ